jgi:diphosphomevalonate decarboxylase
MPDFTATAVACANIAFIKYWGNRDEQLRLPANGSLSMNLAGLNTQTSVTFSARFLGDLFELNGRPAEAGALARVSHFLDHVRAMAGVSLPARVVSHNNFPTGAGVASSAAAFAALSLAATAALQLKLPEAALSRLARLGSGSACRSVPGGFVEWQAGYTDEESFAFSIAPAGHWDLVDCVAVLSHAHKPVGSSQGHTLAGSSPLQAARLTDAPRRLEVARQALLMRDFPALARVVEQDSNLMHAVMMTSHPPLFYWEPASLAIMKTVQAWREEGLPCCYTLDAGPNVHVLTPAAHAAQVAGQLSALPGVQQVLQAHPGGPAQLQPSP